MQKLIDFFLAEVRMERKKLQDIKDERSSKWALKVTIEKKLKEMEDRKTEEIKNKEAPLT